MTDYLFMVARWTATTGYSDTRYRADSFCDAATEAARRNGIAAHRGDDAAFLPMSVAAFRDSERDSAGDLS